MEIDEKYLKLLNLLVRDKRNGMHGIISSLQVTHNINGYGISYSAFMNRQNHNYNLFVEDFEKGNVVFLLPFGVKYMEKEMEEMAEKHSEAIKEFFGEKFREDMIVKISEEERKEEIRKWNSLILGLENWERKHE